MRGFQNESGISPEIVAEIYCGNEEAAMACNYGIPKVTEREPTSAINE
jgi:hypothetical protein